MSKHKKEKWHEKVQHSYLLRKTKDNENMDQKKSNTGLINDNSPPIPKDTYSQYKNKRSRQRTLRRMREKDPL